MQMLQSDWLSYSYTFSYLSAVAGRLSMKCLHFFNNFNKVLKEHFDANG